MKSRWVLDLEDGFDPDSEADADKRLAAQERFINERLEVLYVDPWAGRMCVRVLNLDGELDADTLEEIRAREREEAKAAAADMRQIGCEYDRDRLRGGIA